MGREESGGGEEDPVMTAGRDSMIREGDGGERAGEEADDREGRRGGRRLLACLVSRLSPACVPTWMPRPFTFVFRNCAGVTDVEITPETDNGRRTDTRKKHPQFNVKFLYRLDGQTDKCSLRLGRSIMFWKSNRLSILRRQSRKYCWKMSTWN